MKVFFTASQRGKKQFDEFYSLIHKTIQNSGFESLDDTIISIPTEKFYAELEKGGHKAAGELYQKNLEFIKKADINVFETSLHSLSIGFMVDRSLELFKPTIVLYHQNHPPYFLSGIKNDKLILQEYTDKNLEEVVAKALRKAENMRDKRFNLYLADDLLRFMDDEAKKRGMTKSTFVRNLVLKEKKKIKRKC